MVRKTLSFYNLHEAIQVACGWENCHLFVFRTAPWAEEIAGISPDALDGPVDTFGKPTPDAKRLRLSSYFGNGKADACVYEYDFGDSWEHEIKLRKIVKLPESFQLRLLDGKRAFPPDDCGGVSGYQHCLEVLEGSEDTDGLREWLGDWEPEAFDSEAVKRRFDC